MEAPKIKVILAFAAVYLVWGSTFYGVLVALKSFPPFLLSALRLLIAGTALLIYCVVTKERMPSRPVILTNMICGLVIFVGGIVAVVWAQQYISSSLASIIITTPFWFAVLDKRQWDFYFSNGWIIGGLISGLVGVVLLLGSKNNSPGTVDDGMQIFSILVMIAGSCGCRSGHSLSFYRELSADFYGLCMAYKGETTCYSEHLFIRKPSCSGASRVGVRR